ncbi:MAG: CxxC-x17-CxxC domain-containing protein [Candidatus Nanoarchaeia archaeon]
MTDNNLNTSSETAQQAVTESREMHKIKCSKCGKEDEVPFKPEPGRDVLCKECHGNKVRFLRRRRFLGNRFNRKMYDAKCTKCGNSCRTPFNPKKSDKKVICKDCFRKNKENL